MIQIDQAKLVELKNADVRMQRASAFRTEADPLFFKVQRGEATLAEWQAKVDEIRQRLPYLAINESEAPPMVRARDASGQFIGDDPSTPDVNEAWTPAAG